LIVWFLNLGQSLPFFSLFKPTVASFPLFLLCAFFAWWTDDKKGIERIQAEELEEANKKATSNEI